MPSSKFHRDSGEKDFLCTWVGVGVVTAIVVVALSVAIDPYLIFNTPRIAGLNSRKPAAVTQQDLVKANEVLRRSPTTLLLGTSRVMIGMDADYAGWPEKYRPVYNLALAGPGGGIYVTYRYLQHALSATNPEMVVIGLDFERFLSVDRPQPSDYEFRLSVTRTGEENPQRRKQQRRDVIDATFSGTALADDLSTLVANMSRYSIDIVSGRMDFVQDADGLGRLTPFEVFATSHIKYAVRYSKKSMEPRAFEYLVAIFELCRLKNIDIILFINPVHAEELELISEMGYWNEFENWKRSLVGLAASYSNESGTSRLTLWDFTDYGMYATEVVRPGMDRLRWFLDPEHYRVKLGDLVIQNLVSDSVGTFGVRLSASNIESHLLGIRRRQELYRESNLEGTLRIRHVYDAVLQNRPER